MSIQFEILDGVSGRFTYSGETVGILSAELQRIRRAHQADELSDNLYLAALNQQLASAPTFITAQVHIASYWCGQDRPKKALDAALQALSIAKSLIPAGYVGRVNWEHRDNQPYLRAMYVALLAYMRLRRHKDAVTLIEQLLVRDPDDNQGVRFLLGSEALRAGDYDRSRIAFEENACNEPEYFYELALCYMMCKDWVAAATALRRGFAMNPYIAEVLGGNPDPGSLVVRNETSGWSTAAAQNYVYASAALWKNSPYHLHFTRWVFNHSMVLSERAAMMECKEAILWECDATRLAALTERQLSLAASIDDGLSKYIVKMQEINHGGPVLVWER